VSCSDRSYQFHGMNPETFGGRWADFTGLVHSEDRDRLSEGLKRALHDHQPCGLEFRVVHPDGDVRWLSINARAIYSEEGQPVRLVGASQDVTDRKRADEERRKIADALVLADQQKDDFLAMLAHELRNPLAVMVNANHVLERSQPNSQPYLRARSVIERQLSHLTHLVDELLDLTRLSHGGFELRLEAVDLVELIENTVEDYGRLMADSGLEVDLTKPDQPVILEADPTRMRQALGNLLANAAKFTPPGGKVSIALEVDDPPQTARISVADTGMGISPDDLSRLFEPFVQADRSLDRDQGGLGLGLALVRGIARMHGGNAIVRSEGPGRGATFSLELPFNPIPLPDQAAAQPARTTPRRVLIIEDNVDLAETLADVLKLFGHTVWTTHSGVEGVGDALRLRPDVVLCDLGLPGMAGYEVARAIRRDIAAASIRMIAMSGYGQEDDRQRSLDSGFDAHLTKPVDPNLLQVTLEQVILSDRGKQTASQVAARGAAHPVVDSQR
jgi:PAS domain S-box-containing protein